MIKKIKKVFTSLFIKNVLVLVTGTAFAQILTFIAIPFITRIYGPEAYGIMGTFIAFTAIIIPISSLTYPIAIVLPKKDIIAKDIAILSFYITLSFSFILLIFIFFGKSVILNTLNLKVIEPYLILLPLVVLFSGLYEINYQWFIRMKKFSNLSMLSIKYSILNNVSLISLGFLSTSPNILIGMNSISNGIKVIIMNGFSLKRLSIFKYSNVKWQRIYKVLKKYKDFPLYRSPEVLINSSAQSLPTILLTAFFSPTIAGFYTLSKTALGAPAQLIGKAVGDVFYPKITESFNRNEKISCILIKSTFFLALIGVIPFGTIYLFGPFIFELVFGEKWSIAGEYAKWISIWSYFLFINIPIVKTLPVLSLQRFHLIFSFFMLIVRMSSMIIAFNVTQNALIVIQAVALSSAFMNLLLIVLTILISMKRT